MVLIYENNVPVCPWALGKIQAAGSAIYRFAGRTPGMYRKIDPQMGLETREYLHQGQRELCTAACARGSPSPTPGWGSMIVGLKVPGPV